VRRALREDPGILERVRRTKKERYGDGGFVNVDKRRKTLLAKYGVDNPMKDPSVASRSLNTRRALYGDNPVQRKPVIEKATLEALRARGLTFKAIGIEFGVSEAVVSYWVNYRRDKPGGFKL